MLNIANEIYRSSDSFANVVGAVRVLFHEEDSPLRCGVHLQSRRGGSCGVSFPTHSNPEKSRPKWDHLGLEAAAVRPLQGHAETLFRRAPSATLEGNCRERDPAQVSGALRFRDWEFGPKNPLPVPWERTPNRFPIQL